MLEGVKKIIKIYRKSIDTINVKVIYSFMLLERQSNSSHMVGMVKWLTRRIVAPLLMGSIPITHPTTQGRSQAVRHRTLTPTCDGSIPSAPANFT